MATGRGLRLLNFKLRTQKDSRRGLRDSFYADPFFASVVACAERGQ